MMVGQSMSRLVRKIMLVTRNDLFYNLLNKKKEVLIRMKNNKKDPCPCCSGASYGDCCQKYHSGNETPQTCEQLMRSRYSAFSLIIPEYINQTVHPIQLKTQADYATKQEMSQTKWTKLEILSTAFGQPGDEVGRVEFKAYYQNGKEEPYHHELSRFKLSEDKWVYFDGKLYR